MSNIYPVIKSFLEEQRWPHTEKVSGNSRFIIIPYKGENGSWNVITQILEDKYIVMFFSILLNTVPNDKRFTVAEFLNCVNYQIFIGNFEISFEDGEVRFRTGIEVRNISLTTVHIKNTIYINVFLMDKYQIPLNKIVYGNVLPVQALQEMESGQ